MRLICNGLSISRGIDQIILHSIDTEFHIGRITHLTGYNGIGKTSFLKCLAGYFPPFTGSFILETNNPYKRIDYFGHENALEKRFTARENILWQLKLMGIENPTDYAKINSFIETFNLDPLLDLPVNILSYGQQKRVALSIFLSLPREVYLLDEPFNGLDIENITSLICALEMLSKEAIVMVTSHLSLQAKQSQIIQEFCLEKYTL